jgi:acetyltransferase
VRAIVTGALTEKRGILTEPEAKRVLAAYGIPVVPTEVVLDATGAAAVAARIGFPVAVKILSRQITHKSDVGGVVLDLVSEQAVIDAVRTMTAKELVMADKARIDGFVVQPMIKRPHAVELILGATEDSVFGPILMVGHGGSRRRGNRRQGAGPATARSGVSGGCIEPHARRPAVARLSRPPAGRARRRLRGHDPAIRADR